jgi:hypothetical protein
LSFGTAIISKISLSAAPYPERVLINSSVPDITEQRRPFVRLRVIASSALFFLTQRMPRFVKNAPPNAENV